MGGSPSKMPPIIQRDPLPTAGAFVGGIQVGGSTEGCRYCRTPSTCGPCRLGVAQGISASSAQLYREYGTISVPECGKFTIDSERVRNRELSIDDYKANLVAGRYYDRQDNGHCAQLVVQSADVAEATTIDAIPWSKVRRPKIRKLTSSGGYSSITKLYIKPAIPFRVSFNGQTVDVSVMTLFHPSPIRIENIQHDAVLTLGDPADPASKVVILIPLAGTVSPGPRSQFLSRIVSYLPGVLQPNPVSGLYETISAPTGKDWNLSGLFPGTPSGGETIVTGGYFAWSSAPPMEEFEKNRIVRQSWLPDTIQYGWRPSTSQSTQFVMLKDPFPIGVFDLQTVRMLPATPSEEALPPILPTSVVYTTATQCSSVPVGSPAGRESFETEQTCDPFANIPQESFNTNTVMIVLSTFTGIIALFIGIYFAFKFAGHPKVTSTLKQIGTTVGLWFAKNAGATRATAPPPSPETGEAAAAKKATDQESARIKAEQDKEAAAKKAEQEKEAAAKKEAEDAKAIEAAYQKLEADQTSRAESRLAAPTSVSNPMPEDMRRRLRANSKGSTPGTPRSRSNSTAEETRLRQVTEKELQRIQREAAAAGTGLDDVAAAANTAREKEEAETARKALEAAVKTREEAQQLVGVVAPDEANAVVDEASDEFQQALRTVNRTITILTSEQRAKNEAMATRAKELGTPSPGSAAATAATPPKRRTLAPEPPDDPPETEAMTDRQEKELKKLIKLGFRQREDLSIPIRPIVSARTKAKKLRASPPPVPGQAVTEINEVQDDLGTAVAEAEKTIKKAEEDARRQRAFADRTWADIQARGWASFKPKTLTEVYASIEATERDAAALTTQIEDARKKTERDLKEAKETADRETADKEKVDRDLKAAQTRLRLSQPGLTRATERRNLLSGRGTTRRRVR